MSFHTSCCPHTRGVGASAIFSRQTAQIASTSGTRTNLGFTSVFAAAAPESWDRFLGQTAFEEELKGEVTDCNGTPVSGLTPQISVKKISGSTPTTGVDETITSTSGADTGTTMRWSDPLYIYNLATKSLSDSSATYQITITGPFADVTATFGTKPK